MMSTHLLLLSSDSLGSIFEYLNFQSLLQTHKTCTFLRQEINCNARLAQQTLLRYYSTVYIDSTLDSKYRVTQHEMDIDLNHAINKQDILPIFDPLCFNQMCLFNKTNLFRLYCRLMSYNWKLHLLLPHVRAPISVQLRKQQRGPFIRDILKDIGAKGNRIQVLQEKIELMTAYRSELEAMIRTPSSARSHNLSELRKALDDDVIDNPRDKVYNALRLINVHDPVHLNAFKHRSLTQMELKLFNQTDPKQPNDSHDHLVINSESKFKSLLHKHFHFFQWERAIFGYRTNAFFLAGGSVLKCISKRNRMGTRNAGMQDLDLFAVGTEYDEFRRAIRLIRRSFRQDGYTYIQHKNPPNSAGRVVINNLFVNFTTLRSKVIFPSKNKTYDERMKKQNERMMEKEGFWTKMQFIWMGNKQQPWSVLHAFDLDCCQIGYDGAHVVSTYAFVQSITTNTMVSYKLINDLSIRICKYMRRDFELLVPKMQKQIKHDKEIDEESHEARKRSIRRLKRRRRIPSSKMCVFRVNNDQLGVRRHFVHLLKRMGGKVDLTLKNDDELEDSDYDSDELSSWEEEYDNEYG
eukprot:126578_1